MSKDTYKIKVGLAEMLKGGVIMDVTTPEQAKIAEDAGAVAVMALERIPAEIRKDGGIARMSNPEMIKNIQKLVSIPVARQYIITPISATSGPIFSRTFSGELWNTSVIR